MDPRQTPNNYNNYPPQQGAQSYGPQPYSNQPTQQPTQPTNPQFSQAPQYVQPQPYQQGYTQPQQPYQQPYQNQTQPLNQPGASWYQAPQPSKLDSAPAKASDYVTRASAPPIQTGQLVNGQYSVDFLSDLSVPQKNKFSPKFIIIAAAALIGTLAIAGVLLAMAPSNGGKDSPQASLSSIYTIMADTQNVTKTAGKTIKDSKLRGINSSLNTILLGGMSSLEEPLKSSGNNPSSLKSAANKEPLKDEKLRADLEEARLLSTYDRVYMLKMEFKVQEIIRRLEYVQKRTGSDETKQILKTSQENLTSINKSINDLANSEESGLL